MQSLIFGFLLCSYMTFASREQPWGDGLVMYQVSESLVREGDITVPSVWPPMSHRARDGRIYSQFAVLPSLVHIPSILTLDLLASSDDEEAFSLWWPYTCHITMAACAAGAGAVLFGWLIALGISVRTSVFASLGLGLATSLCVYARQPYSEPLQALCVVSVCSCAHTLSSKLTARSAFWFGVTASLAIAAKMVFFPGVVLASAWLAWNLRQRQEFRRLLGWGVIGALPALTLILVYNRARWGSPFLTGYEGAYELARESIPVGLLGFVASPGKSFFLYSPPAILALLGGRGFYRANRVVSVFVAIICVSSVLIYSRFLNWVGGWCWGPRHLIFMLPCVMAIAAHWIDRPRSRNSRRIARVFSASILVVGVAVQLLGASFYWDHYIRIGKRVGFAWLGEPDRSGAAIAERGRGHCDACFEDMHGLVWLPPLQPVSGHAWLLRNRLTGADWGVAEQDAPWRRYTTVDVDLSKYYARARPDWWVLHLPILRRGLRTAGWAVFGTTALLLVASGGLLIVGVRRHEREPRSESRRDDAEKASPERNGENAG